MVFLLNACLAKKDRFQCNHPRRRYDQPQHQGTREKHEPAHNYWLATHLIVALVTLGALVWTALDLRGLATGVGSARLRRFPAVALAMLIVQLIYGALAAGLRAGHIAADWPLMQGKLFPEGIDWSRGAGYALISDPYLVHFIHRWWAWLVAAALVVMARRLRNAGMRSASLAIHAAFGTQLVLGIATVMSGVALWLAVLHQLTGALLLAATVWGAHGLGKAAVTKSLLDG